MPQMLRMPWARPRRRVAKSSVGYTSSDGTTMPASTEPNADDAHNAQPSLWYWMTIATVEPMRPTLATRRRP